VGFLLAILSPSVPYLSCTRGIRIYHGNDSTSTTGNGTKTFPLFDDFSILREMDFIA
jgi:hypothetical protein